MFNRLIALPLLLGALPAAAADLPVNGGFETGNLGPWTSPQRSGGKKELHRIAGETEFGKFCVRATGDPENKYNNFITLVQPVPALERDTDYILSARARSAAKPAGGKEFKIALRQANAENNTLAYTGFNVKLDGDTWQYYEIRLRPDPRAVSFAVYLIGQNLTEEDSVFADDIELRKDSGPAGEFTGGPAEKRETSVLSAENTRAEIDKSNGLLHSLESFGQIIHPAAKDVSAVFVQSGAKEFSLKADDKVSQMIPFKARADYVLKDDQLTETILIEAADDVKGPVKLGVRHGFDRKQWRNIINALRPLRVIGADKSTIYSFHESDEDLNLGRLDQYQSVCYPLAVLESDSFFLMAGSYDLDNPVTLSPNMPAGYFPSLQRNPRFVKKGDVFKLETSWKLFPKSRFQLRDVWRYYSERIHTADKELSKYIPPKGTEPRTFYPGCFGSSTYFQKNREDRLYPGSNVWFYSWHDNISERYPVKGSWWSDGNCWKEKINADYLKKHTDDLQGQGIKLIFYFRQIANLNQKGQTFPENWYKKKAGGGLHLYGGGYSVKLPPHVAADVGYDSIPWGSYDFANPDYRKFYISELMEAVAYYRPAAIGWDMGNDIHEFLTMAEVYELLRKKGLPVKVVSNESAGPTQAYSDMALLENGLLGGKTAYDFEVAKAFTTAVVCLERWNLFRLAVEANLTGKRVWLADKGLSENKRYLDFIMKKNPAGGKDNIELARLCQLRASLYDLSLGASPGYLEEAKPVPPALVDMSGDVNGILKVNKSFAVKLPNNTDTDQDMAASVWADTGKLRAAVFNDSEGPKELNLRLDKKYFQDLTWSLKDLSGAKMFFVTPEGQTPAEGIKIEDSGADYLLTGKLGGFTALLLSRNK